jgi:hypothetical protein
MVNGTPRRDTEAPPQPANDPADIEDDRHDPGRAHEIESRHDAHSPVADPIIPTRPRAPLTGWLWLSALAAFAAVIIVAAIATRFMN